MSNEKINLFTDLFEEEKEREIIRLKNRTPLWKWIARFLVIGLLFCSGALIFFDYERVCVEVYCEQFQGQSGTATKTIYVPQLECRYTGDFNYDSIVGRQMMECESNGVAWKNCFCSNKDIKITSPYFNIFNINTKSRGSYEDFDEKKSYFDDEIQEARSYRDFDYLNQGILRREKL